MATATLERPRSKSKAKDPTIARRVDLPGSDTGINLKTVGGRITWARFREDMTQKDLAKLADKVRPTIAAYESGRIEPPLEMINKLATILKLSPSFLAFGEHGVQSPNVAEMMINVPEITFGRDGEYQTQTFGMPLKLIQSFAANPRSVKAYVLDHNAPAFNLSSGTRIFADTSIKSLENDHDMYLLRTPSGMEIVQSKNALTESATVTLTGPKGESRRAALSKLDIIGAVVSTLNPS